MHPHTRIFLGMLSGGKGKIAGCGSRDAFFVHLARTYW
jgi:hypothetical protein